MKRTVESKWMPHLALAAAVAALPMAAASLGAQRPTRRPPPPPSAPSAPAAACDSCDALALSVALERQVELARRELERAMEALADQREAMLAARDTSPELQQAFVRLETDVQRARQRYDVVMSAALRRQLERSRLDAERAVRSLHAAMQAPPGWLGATLTMQFTLERDGGKELMRFQDFPTVESVEPNSPAERAGLEARDRLVMLNGRDVLEGTEPLARLLRPGSRLQLRVKRGDSTKDLTVVVGRRPDGEWAPAGLAATRSITIAPVAPPPTPAAPLVPPLPPVPAVPLTVLTREGMRIEVGAPESGTIAGAQVQRVGDLKDYFGVEDGLLVLRVIPGTVADRSGLRGGDVILRAGDASVTTPLTLRRVMDRAADQQVKLEVVRKHKKESVVLRWDRP